MIGRDYADAPWPDGSPTEPVGGFDAAVAYRMTALRVMREAKRQLDAEENPLPELPAVKPLDRLLAESHTPAAYSVDRLAPANARIMLAAQYKAGKTTLVDNLVRALVDGDKFLDQFAVARPVRRLVMVDLEVSEGQRRRWLADQSIAHKSAVVDVVALRGRAAAFNLLDPRCRADWSARLADLDTDWLVLDCLRPILDAAGLDEHRDAGRFLVQFDALLDAANIADALLVDHMGHYGERARGDSRKLDWADASWRLVRETDEPHSPRYFSAYGRDVDLPEGRLAYEPSTRRLSYAAGSRSDAKVEAAMRAVIAVLAADTSGGLSGRALEQALAGEHSQRAVRKAIRLALERALVATSAGERNAKLHRIAKPCEVCRWPLTADQNGRHASCPEPGSGDWQL